MSGMGTAWSSNISHRDSREYHQNELLKTQTTILLGSHLRVLGAGHAPLLALLLLAQQTAASGRGGRPSGAGSGATPSAGHH